jgi:predicted acylesterase/phospholipase RssA
MKKNIALVLSSGGARGFAHIGAINVLKKDRTEDERKSGLMRYFSAFMHA